jgi:hypothetical protein
VCSFHSSFNYWQIISVWPTTGLGTRCWRGRRSWPTINNLQWEERPDGNTYTFESHGSVNYKNCTVYANISNSTSHIFADVLGCARASNCSVRLSTRIHLVPIYLRSSSLTGITSIANSAVFICCLLLRFRCSELWQHNSTLTFRYRTETEVIQQVQLVGTPPINGKMHQ